jgi:hypothetical protein
MRFDSPKGNAQKNDEGGMASNYMHQSFLDIQGSNVDQGMTGSKDFLLQSNTQASNCFISSMPERCSEVKGFLFTCLIVNEDLQLSLMMTSLVLLACKPSDRASNEVWESATK